MNNLISLYRGLPGNREFSGIQELPYFVFNPLRNLLFTKEDIDHSASANDITTELGLDFIGGDTGDDTSKTKSQERAAFEKEDRSEKKTTAENDATPKQKAKTTAENDATPKQKAKTTAENDATPKQKAKTTAENDATPKQKAKANTDRDKVTVAPPELVCIERQKSGEGDCIREGG